MQVLKGLAPYLAAWLQLIFLVNWPIEVSAADFEKSQTDNICCGLNILSYDPFWTARQKAPFRLEYIKDIRARGFKTVRIGLRPDDFMDENNRLNDVWLQLVKEVVDHALVADLTVIIDAHDLKSCDKGTLETCRRTLGAYWQQVSDLFATYPDRLVFEILNEPKGGLTADDLNRITPEMIGVIRKTNPSRTIIAQALQGDAGDLLEKLVLPKEDPNIIVAVHYYAPIRFTLQGASFSRTTKAISGVHWGSQIEYKTVDFHFARVSEWGKRNNRRIVLGEFGTYDTAPTDDRLKWTRHVISVARKYNIPWIYWQFGYEMSIFDYKTGRWSLEFLNALFRPEKDKATP